MGSWAPFWAKQGTTKKGCDLTWAFTRPLKTTVAGARGAQAMVKPWGLVGGGHCGAVGTRGDAEGCGDSGDHCEGLKGHGSGCGFGLRVTRDLKAEDQRWGR